MIQVSVIVVSRHRANALARCVTGLSQLDHRAFELVVVCDPASGAMLRQRPDAARIKLDIFDEANISRARNRGIARAAGDILAFIDDDAVAEPTWLDRLVAPFDDPCVTATGGFVRGRNGVSLQWQAASTDGSGRRIDRPPDVALPDGEVWRTEGTNMAFRAADLRAIGGFDEAFSFYLDETDVNLRLPGKTIIVPDAEVHHGYAESARRRRDRVPRSLFEIGASSMFFWQKHENRAIDGKVEALFCRERERLLTHMTAGRLEPRDVRSLLDDLLAGLAQGRTRRSRPAVFEPGSGGTFQRFPVRPAGPKIAFTGPWRRRKHLESQAITALSRGQRPTLVLFAPDPRVLRVHFTGSGIWTHIGGQFGRGPRAEPALQWARSTQRVVAELARVGPIRGLPGDACTLQKPC